jgi:VCBS repeat-containing protein
VTVNSAAQLMSALASAHAGDTIQLAAGTYTQLVLNNLNFSSAVTITSADSSHPAVLAGLKVTSSSGLTFNNVEMTTLGSGDAYYAFRISDSSNIAFNQVNAHGDPTQAPSTQLTGFLFQGDTGVSITNSTLHDMDSGLVADNNVGLTVSNNTFSNLSKGGVEMGGSSNVLINNNTFTNFHVGAGVHADAIQSYTSSATTAASNIIVTNNLFARGAGDPVQGIFIQDETGVQPYHNLTIANNTVLGGMWNSIYVNSDVTGTLNVSNNLATSWAGADAQQATTTGVNPTTNFQAGVILDGNFAGAQVTETGNTAQYYISNGATVTPPAGNTQVGAINAVTNLQDLHTAVTAAAAATSLMEHTTITGNVLTGATGGQLYLADVGAGANAQQAVGANGLTLAGTYGNLTVHADGSYSYTETHDNLTVGQTYVDHFTTTVANESGQGTSSTLDVMVQGSGVGDGGADMIVGGAGTEVMSGFGAGTNLYSGTGQDTYQINSVSQSTPGAYSQIIGYKAGDIIDLSQLDPNFHIVTKFDGHAHEVVVAQIGAGNWEVYADTTGSGTANFQLHVLTATTSTMLTADSFHL